jgi:hypothetical protein
VALVFGNRTLCETVIQANDYLYISVPAEWNHKLLDEFRTAPHGSSLRSLTRCRSSICQLPPEDTLKCSTELKLGPDAHGAECLPHHLCGMDGDEGVAALTVPKSAGHFGSIRRVVSGCEDKHESPLSCTIRRLAAIRRRQELSTVTAAVQKKISSRLAVISYSFAPTELSLTMLVSSCRRPERDRADEVSIMGFDDEFTLAIAKAAIVIVSSFGALVFLTWIAGKGSFLK